MARNVLTNRVSVLEGLPELKARIANLLTKTTAQNLKQTVFMPAALVIRDEIRDVATVGGAFESDPHNGQVRNSVFAGPGTESKPNALVGINYRIAPQAWLVDRGHNIVGHVPRGGRRGRGGDRKTTTGAARARATKFFELGLNAARPTAARMIAEGMERVIDDAAEGR